MDRDLIIILSHMPHRSDPEWTKLTLYDRRVLNSLRYEQYTEKDVARLRVLAQEMGIEV